MSDERFPRSVVDVLAKRAASICSNPECGALTVGPSSQDAKAVIVGEAAHIYGARSGSARFVKDMTDTERSDVTNGIWLCRNCHKIVDADADRYPAELLFEWRRTHEGDVTERLGKAASLRRKVDEKRLEGFEHCSYLAQQIVIDKPEFWEYRLTAELLRHFFLPTKQRWDALHKGLYALAPKPIDQSDFFEWFRAQLDALMAQAGALNHLINEEIKVAWGAPGEPGSEQEILRMCGLMGEACERILRWEESVRFTHAEPPFEELHELLVGLGGPFIQKLFELPAWLSSVLDAADVSREHTLMLVFDIPDGWDDAVERAMMEAKDQLAFAR